MDTIKLHELAMGGLQERFSHELERVISNIADENTPPDKVREITIKVKLKPNKERTRVAIENHVTTKLAPYDPVTTIGHIAHHRGRSYLLEIDPTPVLPITPEAEEHNRKITQLDTKTAAGGM
ncbi:hypothetical protein [Chrysiogenes arsenatis]|uniref:hypothetical protein n=1 Tax=Chrysiogenes arsenatis TaxID=309797 RepID=UPI0004030633|nr:hypothetical protein [Chrysiogenes arsenatis]